MEDRMLVNDPTNPALMILLSGTTHVLNLVAKAAMMVMCLPEEWVRSPNRSRTVRELVRERISQRVRCPPLFGA